MGGGEARRGMVRYGEVKRAVWFLRPWTCIGPFVGHVGLIFPRYVCLFSLCDVLSLACFRTSVISCSYVYHITYHNNGDPSSLSIDAIPYIGSLFAILQPHGKGVYHAVSASLLYLASSAVMTKGN